LTMRIPRTSDNVLITFYLDGLDPAIRIYVESNQSNLNHISDLELAALRQGRNLGRDKPRFPDQRRRHTVDQSKAFYANSREKSHQKRKSPRARRKTWK
jgi:hypothetical protein